MELGEKSKLLNNFKEEIKANNILLKKTKKELRDSQRMLFLNSFGMDDEIYPRHSWYDNKFSPDQQIRREKWAKEYDKNYLRWWNLYWKNRAMHIAYSLTKGKRPEQIENNYYPGKWEKIIHMSNNFINLQSLIDKFVSELTYAPIV